MGQASSSNGRCWIIGLAAVLGWIGAAVAVRHMIPAGNPWLPAFFAAGVVSVLLQPNFPNRAEALFGSLYGWLIWLLAESLGGLIQRLTTPPLIAEVTPSLVFLRLLAQGVLAAVLVGWFFRIGWLLPIGLVAVLVPQKLKPRLHSFAELHPLQWWWKMVPAVAIGGLVLAVGVYVVLLSI